MKTFLTTLFLISINICFAQTNSQNVETSLDFISKLENNEYKRALDFCDTTVTSTLTPEMLSQMWNNIRIKMGKLKSKALDYEGMDNGNKAVAVRCIFEKGNYAIWLVFSKTHKILSFYMVEHKDIITK